MKRENPMWIARARNRELVQYEPHIYSKPPRYVISALRDRRHLLRLGVSITIYHYLQG